MGKKYIIELEEAPFIQHFDNGIGETIYRVKGFNSLVFDWNGLQMLTPYTEPDTSEAYQRGYDDAKHECQDCQKIMMDAEQERVDKAYQQGVNDAENRKATCEFCRFTDNDTTSEPCKRCSCNYMNMFRPKEKQKGVCFGDELKSKSTPTVRVCVTNFDGNKWCGISLSEVKNYCRFGSSYSDRNLDGWEKTGRNFSSILKEFMNEDC